MNKYLIIILLSIFALGFTQSMNAQILNHHLGQILIKTEYPIERVLVSYQEFEGARTDLKLLKEVAPVFNIYLLEFDYGNIHEERFLKILRNNPMIETAQYNHILSNRAVPNDPQFDDQWQYINTGQSGGTVGADIDADLAWDITTGGVTALGDTIVAAIIDDGFDFEHDDFIGNLWVNHNEIPEDGIDNDNNGYTDDYNGWNAYNNSDDIGGGGHGTPVTGIIGAKGNNGIGVAGVNWDVKLMIIQGGGDEADAIAAYSYCYTQRKRYNETGGQEGAYVVTTNSSWGTDFGQPADAPLWCAFYDTLGVQGIVSCGATINGNQNVDMVGDLPTTCPSDYLIAVTNINRNDQKVSGAGYGPIAIDLGAFGAETWTTGSGNSYESFGGTSGATPHVAGTVALMHAAPCPSFAAYAKSDPAGSALLIKQYILDGTDPNASIETVSVSGGRLNTYNAVNAIVTNCDPSGCFTPFSVTHQNIIDVSSDISWSVGTDTDQSNLRYRELGTNIWIDLNDVTSPHSLSGLVTCTNYEFQIQAVCGTNSTDWTNTFTFETDGCCVSPSLLAISDITDNGANVSWNSVLAAEGYDVRYKAFTEADWIEENITGSTSLALSGLEACTSYEVQIRTNCIGGINTDYTESYLFSTTGCGACVDGNYCSSNAENSTLEWLESVLFNAINNVSGNNDGYANFTNYSTDVEAGMTYDIVLTPGYAGSEYSEYFMVWIDYNQDGDFLDANEIAFAPGFTTTSTITGSITIPENSVEGPTRMRVAQRWNNPAGPCQENYDYGEVEDYCVNITGSGVSSCNIPSNISTANIMDNSIDIDWDDMDNALGYEIRYKELTITDWTSNTLSTSTITLMDLTPCIEHEFQIKTVCSAGISEFSSSMNFVTTCSSSVNNINELSFSLYPNPVEDQLTISFENDSDWSFSILDISGKVISKGQSRTNEHTISLRDIPAGIYLLQLENEGKRGVRKIVKF